MKYRLELENIKCGGCANSIKKGLLKNEKVKTVEIDIEAGIVDIEAAKTLDINSVKADLLALGYPEKNSLSGLNALKTMAKSFVSCAVGKIGK